MHCALPEMCRPSGIDLATISTLSPPTKGDGTLQSYLSWLQVWLWKYREGSTWKSSKSLENMWASPEPLAVPLLLRTSKLMLSCFPGGRILAQQIPYTEFLLELEKLLIPCHWYLSLHVRDVSSFHSILVTIILGKKGGAKGVSSLLSHQVYAYSQNLYVGKIFWKPAWMGVGLVPVVVCTSFQRENDCRCKLASP